MLQVTGKINEDTAQKNMQSEVLFIYKLLGIIAGGWAHYYFIIKTIILLRERQHVTYKRVEKISEEQKEMKEQLTILQTQHDDKICNNTRRKK